MSRAYRPTAAFVTGGGSGIGAGLASALHARGATVVIAGRTRDKLDAVAARHPGMLVEVLDVADAEAVLACAARVAERVPTLDLVVNNAGVQQLLDFTAAPLDPDLIAREIGINFTGLVQVTNAFLPLLRRQSASTLVHMGSGLAFVPLTAAPVYSATKAAVHSFTVSLRRQLKDTGVKVVEVIPPVVETELHRGQARQPPRVLKLETLVADVMAGLDAGRDEIPVRLAKVLRTGSRVAPGLLLNLINKDRG